MNDPTEGRVLSAKCDLLQKYFDEDEDYQQHSFHWAGEEYSFFLCSFSTAIDRLDIWRAYGRDGEGICIVTPLDAFDTDESDQNRIYDSYLNEFENMQYAESKKDDSNDLVKLERVENTSQSKLYKVKYKESDRKKTIEKIEPIIKRLDSFFYKLQSSHDRSKALFSSIVKIILSDLMYLYKSEEYATEREVRIISAQKLSSKSVKTSEKTNDVLPGRIYMETDRLLFSSDGSKLILGPKLKSDMFHYLSLKHKVAQLEYSNTCKVLFSSVEYR